MIASMYKLNRDDFRKLKITDSYSLHRIVYDLFPKKDQRDFLFLDKGISSLHREILIFSERPPEKPLHGQIVSKEIPESFLENRRYRFGVTLNPTKKDKSSGKITVIKDRDQITEWFINKVRKNGIEVEEESLSIENIGVRIFKRKENKITLGSVTFKGVLTVTDRNNFKETFRKGIGRAKSFGFGLLQIAVI